MGRAFEYRRAAKEKRWDKMSKMFPKLGKAITMAAKEGKRSVDQLEIANCHSKCEVGEYAQRQH